MIHLLIEAKKGTLVYDEDAKEKLEAGFATVQESDIGKKQIKRSMTYLPDVLPYVKWYMCKCL